MLIIECYRNSLDERIYDLVWYLHYYSANTFIKRYVGPYSTLYQTYKYKRIFYKLGYS